MHYIFIGLNILIVIIYIIVMRNSLLIVLNKDKITDKETKTFIVSSTNTNGKKRSERTYFLSLVSDDNKHRTKVIVDYNTYKSADKGSIYGQLPVYYNKNNAKLYTVGESKDTTLEQTIADEFRGLIIILILMLASTGGLWYAYSLIK